MCKWWDLALECIVRAVRLSLEWVWVWETDRAAAAPAPAFVFDAVSGERAVRPRWGEPTGLADTALVCGGCFGRGCCKEAGSCSPGERARRSRWRRSSGGRGLPACSLCPRPRRRYSD